MFFHPAHMYIVDDSSGAWTVTDGTVIWNGPEDFVRYQANPSTTCPPIPPGDPFVLGPRAGTNPNTAPLCFNLGVLTPAQRELWHTFFRCQKRVKLQMVVANKVKPLEVRTYDPTHPLVCACTIFQYVVEQVGGAFAKAAVVLAKIITFPIRALLPKR
jgi:hypothetical protein